MLVRFVVVAMLMRLVRLLRRIRITRQLVRRWKLGRFITAMRSARLAKGIMGSRVLAVRISLTDQPGEFCDGIASSVGSEIAFGHQTRSDKFSVPRALTHTR
jgi:hypothetical protein